MQEWFSIHGQVQRVGNKLTYVMFIHSFNTINLTSASKTRMALTPNSAKQYTLIGFRITDLWLNLIALVSGLQTFQYIKNQSVANKCKLSLWEP
jgi:hypothetical protein